MAELKIRARFLSSADATALLDGPPTVLLDRDYQGGAANVMPCREFSIMDDMLNVADTASLTIPNPDGIYSGRIKLGQRVEIDEYDSSVADRWCRQFTGRVTSIDTSSDMGGGSTLLVTMMDLGWHLTSCDAPPLKSTARGTLKQLINLVIDPTWEFASTLVPGQVDITNNVLNRKLKQGRAGVQRSFAQEHNLTTILPYIQVEPGQKPFDILHTYLQREGLLLNVGAKGGLVLFDPDYNQPSSHDTIHYHASTDDRRSQNNVIGRPQLSQRIDGAVSEKRLYRTIINPDVSTEQQIAHDPNAAYRSQAYRPRPNPLPFYRLSASTDSEAITDEALHRRAVYSYQMDQFNSWGYEVDVLGHSSGGAFYVSDSMISVSDTVNQVQGTYYVQSARRSVTEREGIRTHLTLRQPVLDPTLQAQVGGGARKAKP